MPRYEKQPLQVFQSPLQLKCFAFSLPKGTKDYEVIQLFKEQTGNYDELQVELFRTIYQYFQTKLYADTRIIEKLFFYAYQSELIVSAESIVAEWIQIVRFIIHQLSDCLIDCRDTFRFNALWVEDPDTFIFYRMEARDV